jgi:ketosteroid isomerase-like protein
MKFLLTIATCVLAAGSAFADLADDVRCREIGFSQSVENQDINAFRSFIDDDARFVGSGVLRGADQIAEAWSVFFKPELPAIKWRPQIIEVLENGRLALSRGPYISVSMNADGDKVENWGTFNSVWRLNDDGEWRVVFDAGSPATGSPAEETREIIEKEDDC